MYEPPFRDRYSSKITLGPAESFRDYWQSAKLNNSPARPSEIGVTLAMMLLWEGNHRLAVAHIYIFLTLIVKIAAVTNSKRSAPWGFSGDI